jgi:hypothetical protein
MGWRRGLRFVQAYTLLLRIHRVLARDGFTGAQRGFLLPWRENSQELPPDHPLVREVEWAVQQACFWQWRRSECLYRSLAAYQLLRANGARPRFVMAARGCPFASHAWTELNGSPVADEQMDGHREHFRPLLLIPATEPDRSSNRR